MRLLPRSLLGQTMLAVAAALLIAQGLSGVLLYRAAEQRREQGLINAAAVHLIAGTAEMPRAGRREHGHLRGHEFAHARLPRLIRYRAEAGDPVAPGERHDRAREEEIGAILAAEGMAFAEISATTRPLAADAHIARLIANMPRLQRRIDGTAADILVVGVRQQGQPLWRVARVPIPDREPRLLPTLLAQTGVLFVLLTGLLFVILRRITRPLAELDRRTRRFSATGTSEPPLAPSGPDDIRSLIEAHNAMQARIGSMLDEKDVMLGAIGHDLKTPLTALRVRIESVEDDAARAKMAATIEDITRTLDEILALARVGRSDAPPERTDLAALAASVIEEFEDLGDPVALADGERVVAPVHLTWLKRGLRNLVANAVRYGGSAEVAVLRDGEEAVLRVADRGPGIPADRIHEMLEPFTRGEASRNRETGGAGLGLTLARAVAEQHGGTLRLANRSGGGLVAELRVPLA